MKQRILTFILTLLTLSEGLTYSAQAPAAWGNNALLIAAVDEEEEDDEDEDGGGQNNQSHVDSPGYSYYSNIPSYRHTTRRISHKKRKIHHPQYTPRTQHKVRKSKSVKKYPYTSTANSDKKTRHVKKRIQSQSRIIAKEKSATKHPRVKQHYFAKNRPNVQHRTKRNRPSSSSTKTKHSKPIRSPHTYKSSIPSNHFKGNKKRVRGSMSSDNPLTSKAPALNKRSRSARPGTRTHKSMYEIKARTPIKKTLRLAERTTLTGPNERRSEYPRQSKTSKTIVKKPIFRMKYAKP